jgi:hypothetical protein
VLGAVDGNSHHPVAGEAVGQWYVDGHRAVGSCGLVGCVDGERVEVVPHVDLGELLFARRGAARAIEVAGGARRVSSGR